MTDDLDHDVLQEQAIKQVMREMESKTIISLRYEARQTGYEAGYAAALASIQSTLTAFKSYLIIG